MAYRRNRRRSYGRSTSSRRVSTRRRASKPRRSYRRSAPQTVKIVLQVADNANPHLQAEKPKRNKREF